MSKKAIMICPYSKEVIAEFLNSDKGDIAKPENLVLKSGVIYEVPIGKRYFNIDETSKYRKTLLCTCGHDKHNTVSTFKPIWEYIK